MRIKIAENIGFCSGVRRAIDIVEGLLGKDKSTVYCWGEIIHNPQVLARLKQKNLRIVRSLDKVKPRSHLILPSHGAPQDLIKLAKSKHLKIIDVTCPYVSSVQKICQRLFDENYQVIIVGDKKHPEIKALLSLAPSAAVITKQKDIRTLKVSTKIGIISQTTCNKKEFFKIVSRILKDSLSFKELRLFNTICLDTSKRQEEVRRLARRVKAVLVIGSKTSANTKRLYHISRQINKLTLLIQTSKDINAKLIDKHKSVGIISGASTPEWLVKEVIKRIKQSPNQGQVQRL